MTGTRTTPTATTGDGRGAWRARAAAGVVALTTLTIALLLGPRPLAPAERSTGDPELAQRVRRAVGPRPGTRALAVAEVTPDDVRVAGIGRDRDGAPVDAGTAFEIGSVTKALTGMLLAQMDADDVVRTGDRVVDVASDVAFVDTAVGDATLAELAQHRAGLPRLALGGPLNAVRLAVTNVTGGNPYAGWTGADVVDATIGRDLGGRGDFAYSNLGFGLLGTVLGRSADRTYAEALNARILQPLDMTSTVVVTDPAALPGPRADGTTSAGASRDPWIGPGYAGAGIGVWSTAGDMASLVRRFLDGSAPGSDATRPRRPAGGDGRIGLGWITQPIAGREVTWHNGATGGFTSWVGFDRQARRGVVVLSASDVGVEPLGEHLLGVGRPPTDRGSGLPGPFGIVALGLLAVGAVGAVRAARAASDGDVGSRLTGIESLAEPVAMTAVAWALGPWLQVPWWLWSAAATVCGVAAVAVARGVVDRPWLDAGASRWRVARRSVHVFVALVIAVLLVT